VTETATSPLAQGCTGEQTNGCVLGQVISDECKTAQFKYNIPQIQYSTDVPNCREQTHVVHFVDIALFDEFLL